MSSLKLFATVRSAVVSGIRATVVTVEVSRSDGIPGETIVGLAGAAVRESLERIRAACRAAGLGLEPRRTTVNLAPADHPKAGSGLDLPIALGLLCADAKLPHDCMVDVACVGELGLDGTVRPVSGTLPIALAAYEHGLRHLIVPFANLAEAAAISGINVVGVASLTEVVAWAHGELRAMPVPPRPPPAPAHDIDLDQIVGHALPRRALEIAACGGHHLLLVGVPGAGKTLLARALAGILPELTHEEALETSAVYSAIGQLTGRGLLERRPFRAPHHSVTAAGLLGGGVPPRPGEISLAHHGVLFLDELPEFRWSVLECLRQPLEESQLRIVRGGHAVSLPCRFQLVAAMNACPCGHGPASGDCRCSYADVARY